VFRNSRAGEHGAGTLPLARTRAVSRLVSPVLVGPMGIVGKDEGRLMTPRELDDALIVQEGWRRCAPF
jgi:hypothetical protein